MREKFVLGLVAGSMLMLSGCYTTGLSSREQGNFHYSNFIYNLYDPDFSSKEKSVDPQCPLKLAIAQVGENTPQSSIMATLKNQKDLISEVWGIPALGRIDPSGRRMSEAEEKEIREMVKKMCSLARDLGAEYLFVYGGSADYGSESNFLSFFDITLIGAYILPSIKHKAEGRASGAMIDLKTESVIFTAGSEARVSKTMPSYFEYYSGSEKILPELRDILVDRLTDDFLVRLKDFKLIQEEK